MICICYHFGRQDTVVRNRIYKNMSRLGNTLILFQRNSNIGYFITQQYGNGRNLINSSSQKGQIMHIIINQVLSKCVNYIPYSSIV